MFIAHLFKMTQILKWCSTDDYTTMVHPYNEIQHSYKTNERLTNTEIWYKTLQLSESEDGFGRVHWVGSL